MIAIVILLKEQRSYLNGIVDAIMAQTKRPDLVILAVDRCCEDYQAAQEIAHKQSWLTLHANIGMEDAGVLIGRTRNEALTLVPDGCHVIFTDGDCVPSPRFVEHHATYLDSRIPTATTGCRFAQTEAGDWEEDIRLTRLPYKSTFSRTSDRLVLRQAAESTAVLFGCNMGMNAAAIKLILNRSEERLGERLLFSSMFDGEWGFEETSIGPVLYDAGARLIALSPKTSSVRHHWHPSRGAGIRGSAASEAYLRQMRLPSITITHNDPLSKKRSSKWIMSSVAMSGQPEWWEQLFGYLSSREQARLACALYTNTIDIVDASAQDSCDLSTLNEVLRDIECGIDLPDIVDQTTEESAMREPSTFGSVNNKAVSISVVIPLHNQAANVARIFDALKEQTVVPHEYVVVADRCTDTTVACLMDNVTKLRTKLILVHRIEKDDGFRAGQVRNLGVAHTTQPRVLFLDGDCIPCDSWVATHMAAMDEAGDSIPVATFGLRKDQVKHGSSEFRNDTRTYRSTVPIFWRDRNAPVVNKGPVSGHMTTWSCNLGLNSRAIELLTQLNGSVFSPLLTLGKWGGEDTYLGTQLWDNNGILVAISPEAGHVKHIWHPRATDSALGDEAKLTHKRSTTNFVMGRAELSNTVENNLLRSNVSVNVPGTYDMFLEKALKQSAEPERTKRALAYLCARHIEFDTSDATNLNVASAESMYNEIIRVRNVMTSAPSDVKEAARYASYSKDVYFGPLNESGVKMCNKCRTFMRDDGSTRCPMCKQQYDIAG